MVKIEPKMPMGTPNESDLTPNEPKMYDFHVTSEKNKIKILSFYLYHGKIHF